MASENVIASNPKKFAASCLLFHNLIKYGNCSLKIKKDNKAKLLDAAERYVKHCEINGLSVGFSMTDSGVVITSSKSYNFAAISMVS